MLWIGCFRFAYLIGIKYRINTAGFDPLYFKCTNHAALMTAALNLNARLLFGTSFSEAITASRLEPCVHQVYSSRA